MIITNNVNIVYHLSQIIRDPFDLIRIKDYRYMLFSPGYFLRCFLKSAPENARYCKLLETQNPLEFQGVSCGATDQSRTGDLILTKDALYLLSYSSILRRGPRRQLLYLRGALLSNIIMRTDKIFLLFFI